MSILKQKVLCFCFLFIGGIQCYPFDSLDKEENSPCKNGNENGICKIALNCPPARESIEKTRRHSFQVCGFKGLDQIVCCPDNTGGRMREPETPNGSNISNLPRSTSRKSEQACQEFSNEIKPGIDFHIIDGEDAKLGEFPHMAALGYETDEGMDWRCGAALISDRFLVTAAHCIINPDGLKPKKARMGIVSLRENKDKVAPQDYEVEDIITNRNYNIRARINDIALVKLKRSVRTSEYVHPACLHFAEKVPLGLLVTGWGATTKDQNSRSDILQKARLAEISLNECNVTYTSRSKPIFGKQLCAGDATSDACVGDSGGPLQVQLRNRSGVYTIVGVTSYGMGCGESKYPGIYTRIYSYLDWIESYVWE